MIVEISGHKSPYQVFYDWCVCMAMAFQNSCDIFKDSKIYKQHEELYQNTIKQYSEKEQKKLYEMTGRLFLAFENEISDYLGGIYMEAGCGNKYVGQFFTPFHLSELCARLGVDGTDKVYRMNEPSCGGGAMILATAKALKNAGIGWAKRKALKSAIALLPSSQKMKYSVKDNLIICSDGSDKDTLTISADGKYLYGKMDEKTKFKLMRKQ